MSSASSDSETSSYGDADELGDFIVDDVSQHNERNREEEADDEVNQLDRIKELTTSVKYNESLKQKVLKAHIAVLVSALGGMDHSSTEKARRYRLGQDALPCLKDIKRWIKNVDEKNKTFDVALACFDCGLVEKDLLVILCQWESDLNSMKGTVKAKSMERISIAVLELLVLLTWPITMTPDMSENQKLDYIKVKKSQVQYKKCVLAYNRGLTLKAAIRLAIPVIAKDKRDRDARDNSILRLVLFFIRNVLSIEPPEFSVSTKARKQIVVQDNMPPNVTLDDISLNVILPCFKDNKVLTFLLTITGSLGIEFDKELYSQICLECIYIIIKNVPVEDLLQLHFKISGVSRNSEFTTESDPVNGEKTKPSNNEISVSGLKLQELLKEESKIKRTQNQNISTRHGRFGTLLSLHDNNSSYVISGQKALLNASKTLEKLDSTKKWNTRSHFKYDSDLYINHAKENLNGFSVLLLIEFLQQFLTGGCFNKLIESVGWVLSGISDLQYVDDLEKASFFSTIAWFFNFKRERTNLIQRHKIKINEDEDDTDYGSVGAGLNEVCFILIVSYMRESFEKKNRSALHVGMVCFNELLLISHTIFSKRTRLKYSSSIATDQDEADQDLAEGIIRKLFTFNDFLNIIVQIPQSASKHSPHYLSVSIRMVDIILKCFKSFANENIKIYVQSRRKKDKKKGFDRSDIQGVIYESDEELQEEQIRQVSKERKLDYEKTQMRFFSSSTVSSYIDHLSRFEELSHSDIKRCLSYFHQLFVVMKDFAGLYRLDFIVTLQKLCTDLPKGSQILEQTISFASYYMKKFEVAFQRFPIPVELLFPRIEDAEFKTFLSVGEVYERQSKDETNFNPKVAKKLEFIRDNFTLDEKFKILITSLYKQESEHFIQTVLRQIKEIIELIKLGDRSIHCLKLPKSDLRRTVNNSTIRMFLELTGFSLPEVLEDTPALKNDVSTEFLNECVDLIQKWSTNQPVSFEDGKDPSFFLRAMDSYVYDNVNYGSANYDFNDTSIAFETSPKGHTDYSNWNELDQLDFLESQLSSSTKPHLKHKRRTQRHRQSVQKAKIIESNLSTYMNTKSSEFVNLSDDESDEENMQDFFAREEKLRQLLSESGGIVNAEQLKEFQTAWSKIQGSQIPLLSGTEFRSQITSTENLSIPQISKFSNQDDFSERESMFNNSSTHDLSSRRSSLTPDQEESKLSNRNDVTPLRMDNNKDLKYIHDSDGDEINPVRRKRRKLNIDED